MRRSSSLAVVVALSLTGCSHAIRLNSEPQGARVFIDGLEVGTTPHVLYESTAPGRASYEIEFRMHGYKSARSTLLRNFDWATAGLTLGGGCLVGLGLGLGALYGLGIPAVGYFVWIPSSERGCGRV